MDDVVSKVFILPYHLKNQILREDDKKLFVDPEIKYLKDLDDEMKQTLYQNVNPEEKYKKYVESIAALLLKEETIDYKQIKELVPEKLENTLTVPIS